jgi:hypothetical protein
MQIVVTRTRPVTPWEALNALVDAGFDVEVVDEEALASAPLFETPEVDYVFDSLGEPKKLIPCGEVDNVFEAKYGCKHIPDFVGVCATIAAEPTLIDTALIAIQWTDGDGRLCCAVWRCWRGDRYVRVNRRGDDWLGNVCFPRARK